MVSFLFTPLNECTTCALIVYLLFATFLPHFFYYIIQNTSYTHFTLFQLSTSLCLFFFISFSLTLGQFYSTDHREPAELYCEFIIIQLGFFNSHILSTDGSNCETLSERTDHLCPYYKPLSSLPFHLKLTDGTAVMYTGSSLTVRLFFPIQDTFKCSKISLHVKGMFIIHIE